MINPLKVATGGYLKRQTKAVLIIAVAGYLNFQGTPIPPTPPSGGGGGGGSYASSRSRYTYEQQEEDNRLERIKKDNEFIIEFLKTATNIINNQ
jgi:hypothetical protein